MSNLLWNELSLCKQPCSEFWFSIIYQPCKEGFALPIRGFTFAWFYVSGFATMEVSPSKNARFELKVMKKSSTLGYSVIKRLCNVAMKKSVYLFSHSCRRKLCRSFFAWPPQCISGCNYTGSYCEYGNKIGCQACTHCRNFRCTECPHI